LFYTANDGKTKLQVRLEDESVWLPLIRIWRGWIRGKFSMSEIPTYCRRWENLRLPIL